MRPIIVSIALAMLLTCGYAKPVPQAAHQDETGLTIPQLQSLLSALPSLPGTIQAIRFLHRDRFWIDGAAVLTQGEHSGWQIFVLHLGNGGKAYLEWKSGRLDDSFAVSSANQFRTRNVGVSEEALEFSGCAAHNCPDVFSVMLYVSSKRSPFTASFVLGKTTYSANLESTGNHEYKVALDELLKDRTKHKPFTGD
jgi:hypothetical protein